MSISSDMGTISLVTKFGSNRDRADNIVSLSLFECCTWSATLMDGMGGTNGQYHDGDNMSGAANEGFEYTVQA